MLDAKFDSESEDLSVDWTKPVHVLSMGAGVQTTAQILRDPQRYKNGFVLFADTGDEKAETYEYVQRYLKPFCKEQGLRWVTVYHGHGYSLMDLCNETNTLPLKSTRWCTIQFKIKPIHRFYRHIGATKKHRVIEDIGISLDEIHRMNFNKHDPKYIKKEYPLIDAHITRKVCHEIIAKHNFPQPVKSGCDFCPFASRNQMKKLHAEKPERFLEIVKMEENDRYYPKKPMFRTPLRNMLLDQSLDSFTDAEDMEGDTCDSGHCFV